MIEVRYCLPDSGKLVTAFILCEDGDKALLLVPPVEKLRGATITIAERMVDGGYEDSDSNSFPLNGWGAAATLATFMVLVVKDDLVSKPVQPQN